MRFRTTTSVVIAIAGLLTAVPALAHEMFLKAKEYMVAPASDQVVRLINGTFDKSENSIGRDRMADVSIAANGRVTSPPEDAWYDDSNSSYLRYRTGETGTYVIGVSTRPSMIELSRDDFIAYLRHDGILDTLATFQSDDKLGKVRERYSKHVRAIVQIGEKRSADYSKPLGYPVEILLEQNPYDLELGDELSFRVLFNGKPAANQIVRASYEGFHGDDASDHHTNAYNLRTDEDGRARFLLNSAAVWYIALIHMEKVDDGEADYESNWATVTFHVTKSSTSDLAAAGYTLQATKMEEHEY
jgi:uncharacterized GH25 family protein